MSPGRRGLLLMGAFVCLWAAVELLAGGVLARYSPYQVVWMRYATHIGLMLLLWGWRAPASLWRTRRPVYQLARSMLMLVMPASWVVALQQGMHVDTVMAIFWLSPLLILALAHGLIGERAPRAVWAAAVLACLGANLLFSHGGVATPVLLLLPLGMALSFSLYVVMTRSLRDEPLRANLFYTAIGVLLALSPAMPGLWIAPGGHDLLVMVAVGLLGFLTLLALDRMAAAAPVSLSAPLACLQLIPLMGVAWASGRSHAGWRSAVGLLIIVTVALYLWQREPALPVRSAADRDAGRLPGVTG